MLCLRSQTEMFCDLVLPKFFLTMAIQWCMEYSAAHLRTVFNSEQSEPLMTSEVFGHFDLPVGVKSGLDFFILKSY